MYVRLSRWFGLVTAVLAGALLVSACSSGDAPLAEQHAQKQLGQIVGLPVESCPCTTAQGEPSEMKCYDTCFPNGAESCGDPSESCLTVCKFGALDNASEKACEAALPNGGTYTGMCALSGVTPANRAGCCQACISRTGVCGGPADPKACGVAGETCAECTDPVPDDCRVPLCKETCQELVPAPVGQACQTSAGGAGHCSAAGVCCAGCLTPNGACLNGTAVGACGVGGVECVDCDNGLACDTELCSAGHCAAGPDLECDDDNDCTRDGCDEAEGCQFEVDEGASCNDGDGCTENDTCNSVAVCGGTPRVCNDGKDCTTDSCENGSCSFVDVADDMECDDGSSCTLNTSCQGGECISDDSSVVCHDQSNPCVTSSCGDDGMGACTEVNRPDDTACDDGNPCSVDDACQAGVCQGGGTTECDDNNVCTDDSCDSSVGCQYANVGGECADGDLCTINDRCVAGACSGDAVVCMASNECQANGSCDAESGLCSILLQPDGTECGEGGECQGGSCDGEEIPMVDAGAGGTTSTSSTSNTSSTTGTSGTDGEAGQTGGGGSAGDNGSGGDTATDTSTGGASTGGVGGTYTGDTFVREPQGCDCRTAPGRSTPGQLGLGLIGLGLALGARRGRKRRARI